VSLLYAQTHPEAIVSLTLRGISSFDVQEGINFNEAFQRTWHFHPELYEKLIMHLTEEERRDVAGSYAKRFLCGDHEVELAAMKAYGRWGGIMSKLLPKEDDSDVMMPEAEEKHMIAANRIECHYHAHSLWLKDMQYLEPEKLEKIKNIPCAIINGRYDLICPPIAAWRLHKELPKSKLFIIPDAGHSASVRFHPMLYLLSHIDCPYRSWVHKTSLSTFAMSLQRFPYDRGNSWNDFD
jgi:proline iminopeptidase